MNRAYLKDRQKAVTVNESALTVGYLYSRREKVKKNPEVSKRTVVVKKIKRTVPFWC
jgi:hypothetical protein